MLEGKRDIVKMFKKLQGCRYTGGLSRFKACAPPILGLCKDISDPVRVYVLEYTDDPVIEYFLA